MKYFSVKIVYIFNIFQIVINNKNKNLLKEKLAIQHRRPIYLEDDPKDAVSSRFPKLINIHVEDNGHIDENKALSSSLEGISLINKFKIQYEMTKRELINNISLQQQKLKEIANVLDKTNYFLHNYINMSIMKKSRQ